jgi:hypothetical protein
MPRYSANLALLGLAIISCLVPLAGCGGAQATQPTPTPTPVPTAPASGSQFLYVNYGRDGDPFTGPPIGPEDSLQVASLDPVSGALGSLTSAITDPSLTVIGPFPSLNLEASVTSIFSLPSGKYLYFEPGLYFPPDQGNFGSLLGFSILDGGQLYHVNGDYPFLTQSLSGGVTGTAMEGLGRFIYASYSGVQPNQITLFQLNASTGEITQGPTLSDTSALQLTVETSDPAGKFLYAWNNSPNQNLGVSVYQIDATTGALTEISGSPFPVAAGSSNWGWSNDLEYFPMQFVMSSSGDFAYANVLDFTNVINGVGGAVWDLYAFSVDPTTGALTTVAGYPISPNNLIPQAMVVHPNGKFLYLSQTSPTSNGILIFAIDPATGAINPTPVSFVADTYCCVTLLMNPSGSVLLDEGADVDYEFYTFGWHSFTVDGSTGLLTTADTLNVDGGGTAAIVAIP